MSKVQDTNEAEYLAAVERCKAICASMSQKQWILGDEADAVTQKWGEYKLEEFAKAINFHGAACTLGRYRDVCRAFPKNRGRPRFFASAQILATHDDRFAIIERNPAISKAEAREEMRKWREDHPDNTNNDDDDNDDADDNDKGDDTEGTSGANTSTPAKAKGAKVSGTKQPVGDEEARLKEIRRLCNIVVDNTNAASDAADDVMKEEQSDLLKVIEPRLVKEVRKRAEALIDFADRVDQLFAEAAETLEREGSVRTSPRPAGEPRQAGA